MPKEIATLRQRLQTRARQLKSEIYALYLAYRDPRTPWYARGWALLVVAYALSPIDLIPDFIPILGYLDDLILLPMGIALAIKLIPHRVLDEARSTAAESDGSLPHAWVGAVLVATAWTLTLGLIVRWIIHSQAK